MRDRVQRLERSMAFKRNPIAVFILLFCICGEMPMVRGHGYLAGPRSRNAVAKEDGKWYDPDPNADFPMPESCAHCLNRGGVCGTTQDTFRSYDTLLDMHGNPMAPKIQAVYTEGDIIDIDFIITAHHKGHIELALCPDPNMLQQECFDAHPLTFVQDSLYFAPKHNAYPMRGYIAPNDGSANRGYTIQAPPDGGDGMLFKMKYKLPAGVTCEHCLLQWRYITANSCEIGGYDSYAWPANDWRMTNGQYPVKCKDPNPADPLAVPERFANCADIKIVSGSGSGSTSTWSASPTIASPNPPTQPPPAPLVNWNPPPSPASTTVTSSNGAERWKRCGGLNHAPCHHDGECVPCLDEDFVCTRNNEWHWQCDRKSVGTSNDQNTAVSTNQNDASSLAVSSGEYLPVGKWKRCGGKAHDCKADMKCADCKNPNFECTRGNEWHWQCNRP